MLQWIRKHRKALAGISVGAGAFFAAISFITYKVMAAEETTASGNNLINIGISTSDGNDMASVLQMLLVLTVISLAPSILIMLTSFTRIVIVLHFTRAVLFFPVIRGITVATDATLQQLSDHLCFFPFPHMRQKIHYYRKYFSLIITSTTSNLSVNLKQM